MIVTPDPSVLLEWVLAGHDDQETDRALALRDEAVVGPLDPVVPQLWNPRRVLSATDRVPFYAAV